MGQRLAGLPHFPAGLPAVDATHSTASLVAAACGSQLPVAALPGKQPENRAPAGMRARGYGEGAREPDHIASVSSSDCFQSSKESIMSIEGKIKEAAGYVKEEAFEHGTSAESQAKAKEGRDLRNEGRMEDGKAPKTTEPGSGAK